MIAKTEDAQMHPLFLSGTVRKTMERTFKKICLRKTGMVQSIQTRIVRGGVRFVTEKEKMQRQMLYDANYDPELRQERIDCKELCYDYNALRPSQTEGQTELMKRILGKTKGAFTILAPFWCDYGFNVEVGENFFANHGCVILDCAKVTFGENVFVAPNCGFYTAGHPVDAERRNAGLEYAYPITVGDNVWFGGGVQVLPGVTIGSDVVIAAGSVVNRDIPDHVVAGGTPCRVIRPITEADRHTKFDRFGSDT